MRVKMLRFRQGLSLVHLAISGLLMIGSVKAQDKVIKLRNEPISTPPRSSLQPQLVQPSVTGLFLIQFEGHLQSAWQDQLQSRRVQLLRYVPDDAFIARFDNVSASSVRSLPFVRWVGPYRPEYKVDGRLRSMERQRVRMLLSPAASPVDLAIVRKSFQSFAGGSRSRFGAIIQGEATPAQLASLARSDSVLWIEPMPRIKLFDEISSKIVGGDDGEAGTRTVTQQLGFDGAGVRVSVADSGLNNGDAESMHPDLAGRVDAFFHYGTLSDAADEHSHGTHVAGIIAGNAATGEEENGYLYGLGVAPGAHIIAQRIFDGAGGYELPPSFEFEPLTRDAVRAGADIGSNSWGDDTQGRYDISAEKFDALVRDADAGTRGDQPYILEFSAGNAGPATQTIGSPAVAKNVIATGAAQNNRFDFFIYAEGEDAMADFSSRGPTEDGRIKPDIVAPGTWIASLQSASAGDENAWLAISPNYQYQGGTSQSGPHVSGAAAVFVQYYRETHTNSTPSPALVKAALINSAVDMDASFGTRSVPNNDEGWGRVDLTELIGSERGYDLLDQTELLQTGQTYERRIYVATSDEPLKITLVYTDVPGFAGAIPALVNDLDLEVEAPDGNVYRGNQLVDGESVPGAPSRDRVNNVEAVYLQSPVAGEYVVRVAGANVSVDARSDTPGATDQDFALVTSGDLLLPGVSAVFFNRSAYRAPDQIGIKLVDFDLAGQPSVNVRLTSSTEPGGETTTLLASGALGVFTNAAPTVTGSATMDGRLQVAHGDVIHAEYQDASPSVTRIASAVADLAPPVISNVSVTNRFGRTVVSWTTDEPAAGSVQYGTNSILSLAATNAIRTVNKEVALDNLTVGAAYEFTVASLDEAGNATTNDNGGARYSFIAQPAKTVLLVDAYVHSPDDESVEIPVTEYSNALDQTGVSYDVWNVEQRGSPVATDLSPFRVVIWRINDSFYDTTTISAGQQTAIRSYLDSGGSFLLASMEIISRLLNNGGDSFVTNVLHVGQFFRNTDPFGECDDCDEDRGVPSTFGTESDPISDGMDIPLDYGLYPFLELEPLLPNIGPDLGDTFRPTTNAAAVFTEPFSGRACGIRYPPTGQDTAGRVVFLSFPLDAVPMTGPAPNNRVDLLRKVLSFLAPGVGGVGTLALDRHVYTVPSVVTVEVGDSDLAGQGQATVTFFSDTETNGQTATLSALPRIGLFRGTIQLTAAGNPSAPGQLRAKDGDLIRAEYFDASANRAVQALAFVDTTLPDVTGVASLPDYESAEVTWTTSEPTDTFVQYWDTSAGFPRNRIFYDSELVEIHSVLIQGLQADHSYSFQVVSRDAAGNMTVDDNNKQFYTFRTLKPIQPPWSDNLEAGDANWVVFDVEGSAASWRLGVPNNGMETNAASPLNAWGSNLDGAPLDIASTFLISPAIELTGGNVATLRFWHSYDFSSRSEFDLYEVGDLYIFTNSVSNPLLLAEFPPDEFSAVTDGWEPVEIDLTPHIGRVIYLVWDYELFSFDFFESHNRPGWLIDDVSVVMSNVVRGTLVVTNNLEQARFSISGPLNQVGQGRSVTLTNLPLGQYTVTFNPVPFYNTPAPQTNRVDSTTPVVFQGNYTFADTNHNGISDEWEQHAFNEVSTNRTQTTDTDGDGTTDYAEFIAGTDPNNSLSALELPPPTPQPGGSLKFDWPSVPEHAYRLVSSEDLVNWTALSDWIRATTTMSSAVIAPPANNVSYFYRLEVRP